MTQVFVYTSAMLAVLDGDDANHRKAAGTWSAVLDLETALATTNYVVVETFTLIQRRLGLAAVHDFTRDVMPLLRVGRADLCVVVPITSHQRGIPSHVAIQPPQGGLTKPSDILCDAVRSVAKERLGHRLGSVEPSTMRAVEERLRLVLGL